ncbi:23S rRNA (pseudouridine(1915)-N(3))-methyltransferase RlmH [Roseibacillus ishigakijimensis]|uniref:Ribosomal RNA large subunit methyltransferase H n=1 Tax=Roseibacillus ishigakijimensis TaxID=454146 RepID=A0A934RSX8_9BACT|nr:23S rRNA (pseudouridine(1915)-N(3))-methyltransferase RlmH [Roseibacillus ishigakijimensis]MBK1834853.1 23S rRNA (pseudouridine(1915)-N(3))-methyltransferase RlmH [Roseibacillus ishigakijimensis]
MTHRLLVVGKPALPFAKNGLNDYLRRLQRYGKYSLETLKDGPAEQVSQRLLAASERSFRIVLDERGQSPTTRQLADLMKSWIERPDIKEISYLIGPSDGHLPATRAAADYTLALSSLVLQHELATLMLAEQLYRLATIHAGTPYHRD